MTQFLETFVVDDIPSHVYLAEHGLSRHRVGREDGKLRDGTPYVGLLRERVLDRAWADDGVNTLRRVPAEEAAWCSPPPPPHEEAVSVETDNPNLPSRMVFV